MADTIILTEEEYNMANLGNNGFMTYKVYVQNAKRVQIRDVLNSYESIIEVSESKEFFNLFCDLVSVMEGN